MNDSNRQVIAQKFRVNISRIEKVMMDFARLFAIDLPASDLILDTFLYSFKRWEAILIGTKSIWILLILLVAGCNDPLPPYERPKVIITTTISTTLDTVYYVESFEIVGPDSALVVFVAPNPALFSFYAENLYEETLYGKALISGKLELWVTDQPEIKRTIPITEKYLMPTSAYDSKAGYLRLDSKTPLWFQVPWDMREDNGRWVYHDLPFWINNYRVRVNGVSYRKSFFRMFSPKLQVRVALQLFPLTSTFTDEQAMTLNIKGGIIAVQP